MGTMTNRTTPDEVGRLLNEFVEANPIVGDPGQAPSPWDDLIPGLDGYNEYATIAADPKETGEKFVVNFADRQVTYRFDHKQDRWTW